MVSIFKAIRENDLQLLTYFIDSSIGDLPRQFNNTQKIIQQQLKTAGLKNFDLNKRSNRGRTPLHVAVTWNRLEIAQALIDCPLVNVNLRDRENGWTALHRALYMGNVEIARMLLSREDIDPSIKDWEGLSAFELYSSTIDDTFPKERSLKREEKIEDVEVAIERLTEKNGRTGGTDLYTWGHNTNYVLGHADSENRLKPERVKLQLESQRSPCFMQRPHYLIQNVTMSKYHMAILTSDTSNNLLVCGFGRGGRLGLGKDAETQFVPVPVQWPERIVSVALGRDHTLAVTENGNVISFGNNSFGQLGYETDGTASKDEGPMQALPRKIQAQSLKKQAILGAAASRIHSVVYTSTDIFTFGYNQGQLGYQQPDPNDTCQIIPRKVSMSTEILQVVANDNTTAILNKSHEIILLCNYNQQRLFLPVNRFPGNIVVHRSEPNYPVKLITSGSEYLGAVTNTGDVFVWTCRSTQVKNGEHSSASGTKKAYTKTPTAVSNPKRIWTSNKPHLAAVDGSLGQHGEMIICTKSGHVFVGRPDSNGYRFLQIPYLQRCIQVCANSSGAFAAIRSEYIIPHRVTMEPSTLENDLSSSLPHVVIQKKLQTDIATLKTELEVELAHEKTKYINYGIEEDQEATIHRKKLENLIRDKYETVFTRCVDKAWDQIETMALEDKTLDIIFQVNRRRMYCHSALVRCRSTLFNQLAHLADRSSHHNRVNFKLDKRGDRVEITIDDCETTSVLLLLDYLYTDEYQHPMQAFFKLPALCLDNMTDTVVSDIRVKQIQKDLITLAEICQLPELISSAQSSFSHKPFPTLRSSLKNLLAQEKGADVNIIHDKGKQELKCHEIILRQRCPFFKNLFQPNSVWTANRLTTNSTTPVYFDHIPDEILQTIVQYIYLDEDDKHLFLAIEKDTEESMLQYLLAFLCEADFLLLHRLKSITEKALIRFVKLRSATTIFEYANNHLAESLKIACLQFIMVNLPVFLGSSMLDDLPPALIRDVETFVRNCQIEKMPLVQRSHFDFIEDDLLSLEQEDIEFSSSIFASTRGDGSVTTFDEVLVTYHPQKPSLKHDLLSKEESLAVGETASPKKTSNQSTGSNSKPKKGVRVSLDNLEQELKPLERRRSSAGWAITSPDASINQSTKPSLREIIENENQPVDPAAKLLKTAIPKKISQKERKRLAQQQELATVVASSSSSSSSKSVWGKVPVVEAKPIRKIIAESSHSTKDSDDRKGKKIYVREEEAIHTPPPEVEEAPKTVSFNPVDSLGPSFSLTPIRRLKFANGNSSSDSVKKSFETIQKQQALEDNWKKGDKAKKNILRIQKEEQALESINQFYIQTFEIRSGEWCNIKRISTR